MQIFLGQEGDVISSTLEKSHQLPFEKTVKCSCGADSHIAFVGYETGGYEPDTYVCNLKDNKLGEGGAFWPHDVIAVAVYFCEKGCAGGVTAVYNQA